MKYRYTLLFGRHIIGRKIYRPGDTFECDYDLSNHNLDKRFLCHNKVEKVNLPVEPVELVEPKSVKGIPDGLESMTVNKLKELAKQERIEVPKVIKKKDLIKLIRSSI
jgi:hypothetical protein